MKTQNQNLKDRRGESGNVLFLILIAVALFAALSYAVTQSTRSGGGDASKEKSLVSSAALTQYPASIKTAIVRMTVSNGVAVEDLLFTKPADFDDLTDADATTYKKNAVFYPTGGGATYTKGPAEVSDDGASHDWVFNAENEVKNIGTTATSGVETGSADIIAFLPHVSKSICTKIHEQLGITGTIPAIAAADISTEMVTATPGILASPAGAQIDGSGVLAGQPQGCFTDGAGTPVYTYYHVLVER